MLGMRILLALGAGLLAGLVGLACAMVLIRIWAEWQFLSDPRIITLDTFRIDAPHPDPAVARAVDQVWQGRVWHISTGLFLGSIRAQCKIPL